MDLLKLKEQVVRDGIWEIGQAPSPELREAFAAMRRLREPKLREHPRLVNHFALGADPELAILSGDVRINASQVRLYSGQAFGADLSGRQAELRPAANRWALAVTASVLQELRFLVTHLITYGLKEPQLQLCAPPWNGRDGFGGHVHFGRKRKLLWPEEMKALDRAYFWMGHIGLFSQDGIEQRKAGTGYGQYEDYREQNHGYEYRGYPTWLDSPWLAYFTLTLSKLLAVKPEISEGLKKNQELVKRGSLGYHKVGEELLRNIFAYFQGLDDDARLVYYLIERLGLPRYAGGDIRSRWGLSNLEFKGFKPPDIYPPCIAPGPLEIQEVFLHLIQQKELSFKEPRINWPGARLAEGFAPLSYYTNTVGTIGIGEIVWNLCCYTPIGCGLGVSGHKGNEGADLAVARELEPRLVPEWKELVRERCPWVKGIRGFGRENGTHLLLGYRLRQPHQMENARRLLTCGVFPIWEAGKESAAEAKEFLNRKNPPRASGRMGCWMVGGGE